MTAEPRPASRIPLATYRLQLHAGFTLDAARRVLPYLDALGISHVYLSPIFAAEPGSTHGYDVVDPTRLNPELGGESAYRALVEEQQRLGLGQILDVVPNHMSTGAGNDWWQDVLRRGPASPYARSFDIDWEPGDAGLRGKVLLPVLGDGLEQVLERGELTIEIVAGEGTLRYFESTFPLAPGSLASLAEARVDGPMARDLTPGDIQALLGEQHYVLAYWRSAKPRVNYRRFFLVDELVGVRVEDPEVFAATHELILRLIDEGAASGLRIDHPDGLADPAAYLERLRAATGAGGSQAPYIVVEKILAANEELPASWACDGTTGYDFLNEVNRVLVDGAGAERLREVYGAFTGRSESFQAIAYESRRHVVAGPLAGQVTRLALRLYEAAGARAAVTREDFAEAVRMLVAGAPVYRSYARPGALDRRAAAVFAAARAEAAGGEPTVPAAALDAAADLLARPPEGQARGLVMQLQQLMPAIQAKGLEDAAFYRYFPLASLCEVGGRPDAAGMPVAELHARNRRRAGRWPSSMLATATHDHKRGEDVRARLNVLSEIPDEWAASLERWSELNRGLRPPGGPSRLDEYLLYQTLLGIWPPAAISSGERPELLTRVGDYAVKAAREAGEQTTWEDPNARHEDALRQFADALFAERSGAAFLADFEPFARRVAALGAINSLAQLLVKLTSPGVPDTYQGAELWDLSLVDPDNRRAVDYERRAALLAGLRPVLEDGPVGDAARRDAVPRLLAEWPSGAVKLYVLARTLHRRRALDPLFLDGDYLPLEATGERSDHVIAYARTLDERVAVTVVARLPAALLPAAGRGGRLWAPEWGRSALRLPDALHDVPLQNVLTGEALSARDAGSLVPLRDLLGRFPVALLEPANPAASDFGGRGARDREVCPPSPPRPGGAELNDQGSLALGGREHSRASSSRWRCWP